MRQVIPCCGVHAGRCRGDHGVHPSRGETLRRVQETADIVVCEHHPVLHRDKANWTWGDRPQPVEVDPTMSARPGKSPGTPDSASIANVIEGEIIFGQISPGAMHGTGTKRAG